jgi:hypothetical protein
MHPPLLAIFASGKIFERNLPNLKARQKSRTVAKGEKSAKWPVPTVAIPVACGVDTGSNNAPENKKHDRRSAVTSLMPGETLAAKKNLPPSKLLRVVVFTDIHMDIGRGCDK